MKKIILSLLLLMVVSWAYSSDLNYKYTSSVPVQIVQLSKVDVKDVERLLNSSFLTVFCLDSDNVDKEVLSYLGINETVPTYKITNSSYKEIANNVYEIRKNKLLFLYNTSLNDKKTLDIIGEYIAKNGGVFAYINKVPPHYKHILASGVAVNKIIPDADGGYAIDVARRNIKVKMLKDDEISEKLKYIKSLKVFGINITYIVTGSESIGVVEKTHIDKDELDELANYYWFKNPKTNNYTHLYVNPAKLEDVDAEDTLALSYYPTIYLDKAPYTFENDPIGGYYPTTTITYKGTPDYGY